MKQRKTAQAEAFFFSSFFWNLSIFNSKKADRVLQDLSRDEGKQLSREKNDPNSEDNKLRNKETEGSL